MTAIAAIPAPPKEPDARLAAGVVAGSLAIFLLIAALMFRAGLFDRPTNEVDSDVLAAVLVLVGTLLTELLVAAGLILKHSFDLRTYQLGLYEQQRLLSEGARDLELKAQEQARLEAESKQAELNQQIEQERLRKDTVLKAVELLSDDTGKDAAPAQQIGALQALATLGELPLAVSLLDQRWSDNNSPVLPVAGALAVLDCVFHTPGEGQTEEIRREAGSVLLFNAEKLITATDVMAPRAITSGTWHELSPEVALRLVLTLSKASARVFPTLATPPSDSIRYVLSYLYVFATTTKDDRNKLIAAHTALELARALPRGHLTIVRNEELDPTVIEEKMRTCIDNRPVPAAGGAWVALLHRWADGIELNR